MKLRNVLLLALGAARFLLLADPLGAQTPDLVLNPGSSYVEIGRSIPWGASFNRTYVLVPNSPNASLCVYVVNNNPTNAHTFALATFQAADPRVADYSTNTGRYNPVPLVGTASPVAASSMTSTFTQATAAAKIAMKFSGSSSAAGNPDTADIFAVQTTSGTCGSASLSQQVQGTTAIGGAFLGNPIVVAGLDASNLVRAISVIQAGTSVNGVNGVAIGNPGAVNITGLNVTTPAGANSGPLAVGIIGTAAGGTSASAHVSNPGSCSTNVDCGGLFVRNAGYGLLNTNTYTTSGTALPLWGGSTGVADRGVFSSCIAYLNVTTESGTGETLDVYLQDSPDGSNWNDRLHFAQVGAANSFQWGAFSGNGAGVAPAVVKQATLTAATELDGPIGPYGRATFVIAGTTPSFTLTLSVSCR